MKQRFDIDKICAWFHARRLIRRVARAAGVTPQQCRRDMVAAIDAAWAGGDPAVLAEQLRRFPAGKPTVEQFLTNLSQGA